jgi:hypothetical protein
MHCRSEAKAFCRNNVCVGCQMAGDGACGGDTPACDTGSGRCVQCVASSDCGLREPVCNTMAKTCGRCTGDGDCLAKAGGPGVCMTHQDGRCATDAETFYVSSRAGCANSVASGGGSAATPLCGPQAAIEALRANRRVLVIRGSTAVPGLSWTSGGGQVSVLGQEEAVVTGMNAAAITVAAGDLYVRNLSVANGNRIGIVARGGATLRLERVRVKDNRNDKPVAGGIFIDGAGFDIKNSVISGNGPGEDGPISWGGLLVKAVTGNLRRLERVSVVNNLQNGVVCAVAISGTGVFAEKNEGTEVTPSCGFMTCPTAGASCGSELVP